MKNKILKWLVLIIYAFPYPFFCMHFDAEYSSMLFYLIMIGMIGTAYILTSIYNLKPFNIYGSISSVVISYILMICFMTEKWLWYFKPFAPEILIFVIWILTLIVPKVLHALFKKEN